MTLTFNTHLTSLTHLFEYFNQTSRPMAATVSKYIIFNFAHAKVYVTKFDLGVK